jgi:hypothetical protein
MIDGHLNNTRLANGEEGMPDYVFEIRSPKIRWAIHPTQMNDDRRAMARGLTS